MIQGAPTAKWEEVGSIPTVDALCRRGRCWFASSVFQADGLGRAGSIPVYDTMKIYNKLYVLRTIVPNYHLVDISDWDIEEAKAIIANIEHAYGFRFQRRGLEEERLNGQYNVRAKIIKESGTYYINAYTETLEDIKARIELNHEKVTGKDHTLVRHMEQQGYNTVVRGINDKWSCVFNVDKDVVLDVNFK